MILIAAGSLSAYLIIGRNPPGLNHEPYEINVPAGSRSNVILADGTRVWLNAGSRLTYSQSFGITDRTVYLEGEGYFTVRGNLPDRFRVVTPQLEFVALGTSFNIKSYPQENFAQATLISGSLLVNRNLYKNLEKGIVLEPNQQITYYKQSGNLEVKATGSREAPDRIDPVTSREKPRIILSKGIDPEMFTAWKDNRLIFDNEVFENILVQLERRFGVSITILDDEIRSKRFNGRFDEITIEQALGALKFASPFEYYIKHDSIFIQSQ
jgi:transmembrane sensor